MNLRAGLCTLALGSVAVLGAFSAHAAADVGTDAASAIKGQQKVVIAEFGVEFYTQLHAQGRAGAAAAGVTTALTGVSDPTLQAITDQAYADTVASLQAAGFEVLDAASLQAQPGYQELVSKYGLDSPYTFNDESFGSGEPSISKIFAPSGMKSFFSSSALRGSFGQRTDSQNQGRGDKEGKLAEAMGATLLHVHYLASFGIPTGTKNGFLSNIAGKARAGIELQPVLLPEETEIQFVTSAGKRTFTNSRRPRHSGAVFLKEPLAAANNIFTLQDTTTAASKRSDTAFNAISGLFGSGAAEKNKTSEAAPESEDAFRATFQPLISEAAGALVGALAHAR